MSDRPATLAEYERHAWSITRTWTPADVVYWDQNRQAPDVLMHSRHLRVGGVVYERLELAAYIDAELMCPF